MWTPRADGLRGMTRSSWGLLASDSDEDVPRPYNGTNDDWVMLALQTGHLVSSSDSEEEEEEVWT